MVNSSKEARWNTSGPTSVEQCIPSEDVLPRTILHEPADTVLGMARCVDSRHSNLANLESLAILGGLRHTFTVFAANDRLALELRMCQLKFQSVSGIYLA
jgi:hypothetical protein